MFIIISLFIFIGASAIGGMIIGGLANAWIIPTYFPGMDPLTYIKALIISAIIVVIIFIIFSPKIHSERLKEYMSDGYRVPDYLKKRKK